MNQSPAWRLWPSKRWFQFLVYPHRQVPLTERGRTQEAGFPWRVGKCRVFRIPLTRFAVAFGQWTGHQERELVDGVDTFRLREVPDWRSVVDVQPQNGYSGPR